MPAAEPHDPFAALRERNYQFFVGGWLPASIGLQMQSTALAWEIYERTRDPLSLGIVGLARALPTVLLALPAGQIVDLLDRRRVLGTTQIGFTAASLLLMLGSLAWERGLLGDARSGVWFMYLLIALTGGARVFNGPSRSSLLPLIVRGGALGPVFHNAVTWNSGVFQLSATLGPVLSGALIAWTGQTWPVYALAATSSLWFALACHFIRPYDQREEPRVHAGAKSVWRVVRPGVLLPGMLEGVQHVWREKTVLGALALDLFAVLLGGATALMPIYAKDILHVGPIGLGTLKAAPYVGALLMALLLAHRAPFEKAGRALLWSVAGFGVCTIIFGISKSFALSLAMLATLGALDNVSVVVRHVLVNVRTPDRVRGRVAAVNSVFIDSSNELGGFESGLVAKFFGPVVSVVSGGIGTILVVLGIAWWLPELRRLGRLTAHEPQPVEQPPAMDSAPIEVPAPSAAVDGR
jgi:MFS family permease